jgi:glycosyltransferase involved in cell wall biosynthesis
VKLSIIIPTHNRADSLNRAVESIIRQEDEADFEIIIVDNNSTDHTQKIAESFSEFARYVFESNTSFTRARKTGADNSIGEILLYLDDDVLICPESLKEIVSVFEEYPECGVLAGKILPQYEEDPPDWAIACQRSFNGWSLFHPGAIPLLGAGFQEVKSAFGPMMAVSRKAYEEAGGFPPDTIGVETNRQGGTFRKLYVGPGDYGLCKKVRDIGYKIYYTYQSLDSVCHFGGLD